eukprot:m.120182 g.120182  ORF g.120182 m.120182 type:complete len:272 (+) comp11050_c0_seq3:4513-5328(+)
MLLCLRRVRCPAVHVLLCLCNHSCTQRFLSTHSIHVVLRVRPMNTATATTRGLHQGTSGNVSARVPGGLVITPSGMPYEDLKPEHMVLVDTAGGYYGPLLPSSEWRMHYDVYKHKPDAMAVLHAHPTYCTALAAQEKGIPAFHYMVAAAGAKEIKCAQYATFGTQELSDSIMTALSGGARACLMANHGMICYANNCRKALDLAVEVETLARQYHLATVAGQPTLLGDDEMDVILAKFRTYGKQESELAGLGSFDRKHAVIPPPRRDAPSKL